MEFIKDQEKRILLSAISREKKVIKEHSELKELIPVIERLDYYFMYDRLFKKIYKQAIDEFLNKLNELSEYARPVGWSNKIEIITMSTVRDIAEQLKAGGKI